MALTLDPSPIGWERGAGPCGWERGAGGRRGAWGTLSRRMGEGRGEGGIGGSRVKHFGNTRMIHYRQGLALGFETRDHFACVHADLDDLESDASSNWLFLLGHIDHTETTLTQFLQQLIITDNGAGTFERGRGNGHGSRALYRWAFQEAVVLQILQQGIHFGA